jgi:penicillin-binding protein A
MTRAVFKLGRVLLIAFALIAFALAYWGLAARQSLLAREENPRLIVEEQRTRRGMIVDRNGEPLAQSILTSVDGGIMAREYPSPAAAPVIGYYSIRHGASGIEGFYDELLSGVYQIAPSEQTIRQILHQPQVGGDVQITIDYAVQEAAADLLRGHTGAIVLARVSDGEILAMASAPTYDPNRLEASWDSLQDDPSAPLLNRATQGLYQPGTILQTVLIGTALDHGVTLPTTIWNEQPGTQVDGTLLPCAAASQSIDTFTEAFLYACPAPMQLLTTQINARRLNASLQAFGLLDAPGIMLPATSSGPVTFLDDDLFMIATGQGDLTVTPLQMAQVAAGFANHGEIPAFRIVRASRTPGGEWQTTPDEGLPRGMISRTSADTVTSLMRDSVLYGASSPASFLDARVFGHTGLAVAGPEGQLDAWFIGFATRPDGRTVAVAVLLENEPDAATAARIGGEALKAALESLDE